MKPIRLTTLLLLLLLTGNLIAQNSIDELNRLITDYTNEINRSEQLLVKNHKNKSATQNKLSLVNKTLRSRRGIVSSLDRQITILDRDITAKNKEIEQLEARITLLRQQYASMIYSAYKNYKTNSALAFLFASRDFNDATLRIQYMRRYNAARKRKAAEIDSVSTRLKEQIAQLDAKRLLADRTRRNRNSEIKKLSQDEARYRTTLKTLQNDEKKIRDKIIQQEKQRRAAQSKIDKLISATSKQTKSSAQIQKDVRLTGQFDQNKGRLPIPLPGGVITDHFGEHPHPTQKGLKINNKGVDITGEKGSPVKCVFDGTVMSVNSIPGMKNVIIISHGDYFTVYCNIVRINVKTGDKVKTSQPIGSISESDDPSEYVLHFELWKQTARLNPEPWLQK